MPQFDFLSYFNQIFWLILFFGIFYIINSNYLISYIIILLKTKKYYLYFLDDLSKLSHKFNINIFKKLKYLRNLLYNEYYICDDDLEDFFYQHFMSFRSRFNRSRNRQKKYKH